MIFLAIFTSCHFGIPKEKLTVIENITLGRTANSYFKEMDSLQIPSRRFITKTLIFETDELMNASSNIYYSSYYTKLFNFSEFQNPDKSLEHLGLIQQIPLEGTSNIFALLVILCRTKDPWLAGDALKFKSVVNDKFIRLEVNNVIIDKIKKMYITKYGEPKSINISNFNTFYKIDGKILARMKDNDDKATTINWETEYYNITFFTGYDLKGIYYPKYGAYEESTNSFAANVGNNRADSSKGELDCSSYAYIYYELNEKAIKKLKLNNIKL